MLLLGAVAASFLAPGVAAAAAGAADIPRIALLPPADLTGAVGPRARVEAAVRDRLHGSGFELARAFEVLDVLERRRVRYTAGVGPATLAALREHVAAAGVLVTSIEEYEAGPPPRVALSARLVSTDTAETVWAEEVALTGRDSPGLLGLGEIDDPGVLLDSALPGLLETLSVKRLAARGWPGAANVAWKHRAGRREHRPKRVFRQRGFEWTSADRPRIAVLPFENLSRRADAGEIVSGLYVIHLAGRRPFAVIEPGAVREALLRGRIIQHQGLSFAQAELVREMAGADLAVTGRVLEFEDFGGDTVSRVGFSVWVIDARSRTVVWSAYSANHGDDGVLFFDVGRVRSARALAARMVRAAAAEFARKR